MPQNFDAPLFILDGPVITIDTKKTPYLYNNSGRPLHLPEPKVGSQVITATEENTELSDGNSYDVTELGDKKDEWKNVITKLDFGVDSVVYKPMWASKKNCQAFGITLLKDKESLKLEFSIDIEIHEYTYGIFAGYQSPYIGFDRSHELLPINATDLELHAFPHVFCSQGDYPLVISVGRYRANKQKIYLADLWVKQGDMLYVPPKYGSADCVDLHGNRNSARACMDHDQVDRLNTQTILAKGIPSNFFYESHATVHSVPT